MITFKMDTRIKNNVVCVHKKNHFHELLAKLKHFAHAGLVTDLVLVSSGEPLHIHQIILSCFSNYFEHFRKQGYIKYFVHAGGRKSVLEALVDYIYEGVTCIPQIYKNELILAATTLHIKEFATPNISDSCTITCSDDKTTISFPNHKSKLSRKIGEACQNPSTCDVIFVVSDKYKVSAHACILSACSSFLLQIFTQHCAEKKKPYIVALQNVKKADLELVLEFCYRGKVSIPNEDAHLVYNVADLLGIDALCKLLQPSKLPLIMPAQEKRKCPGNVVRTTVKPIIFADLLKYERLTDVLLCTKQKIFKAHSVILCVFSIFFKELANFLDYNVKDIIILVKDFKAHDIEALLEYIYIGEAHFEGSVQEFCETMSEWVDLSILPISSQETHQILTDICSSREKCHSKMNSAIIDETVGKNKRRQYKKIEKCGKEDKKKNLERGKFVAGVKEKDIFVKENRKESENEMSKVILVSGNKETEFLVTQEKTKDCNENKAESECHKMNCGIVCVDTEFIAPKDIKGNADPEGLNKGKIKNIISIVNSVEGGTEKTCKRVEDENKILPKEKGENGTSSLMKEIVGNMRHLPKEESNTDNCPAIQKFGEEDSKINAKEVKSDDICNIKKLNKHKGQNSKIMNNKPKKRLLECQTCNEKFDVRWDFKFHLSEHPQGNVQQCKLCPKKFHKPNELQIHLHSHTGARPLQCAVCGMSFMGKNTLRKHEHVHLKNKSTEFQCEICKKTFSRKQYLQEHKRTHSGNKPYKCDVCHKSFVGKTGLNHHKKTHKSADEKKSVVCEICGKSFTRHALWTHMKHHNKEHKCEFCSKCFATTAALKTHMAGAHLGHSWHHCDTCGKGFVQKGHLSRHLKTHEQDKVEMITCNQCPSKFKDEVTLKAHTKRKHAERSNKSPTCGICGKHFSTQSALSYHQRLHFHERPHRCNICDKTFAMPYRLRDHIRLHHSDEKLFSCSVCSKKCATKALLNQHLLTHRPTFITPKIKPLGCFTCIYCDKTFPTKLALSNHSRTHTFSRPYQCNVCKKAFRYQDSLLKHLRIHPNNSSPETNATKELPCIYTIQVCRTSFAPVSSNIIDNNDYPSICQSDVLGSNAITEPVSDIAVETIEDKGFLQLKTVDETYLSQNVLQSNQIEYLNVQSVKENSESIQAGEKLPGGTSHTQRPFSITIDGNLCCNSTFSVDDVSHTVPIHSQRTKMEVSDADVSVNSHVLLPTNNSSNLMELTRLQVPLTLEQSTNEFDGTLVKEFSL